MKTIPVCGGHVARVDDADFDRLSFYSWHMTGDERRMYPARGSRGRKIKMHHDVIGLPPAGFVIDHIDGDPLNNQRANLRVCTQSQNLWNRRKTKKPTSSRFKGVWLSRRAQTNPWRAQLKINGKITYLGSFAREEDAAAAVDRAAKEHRGEYAKTNF